MDSNSTINQNYKFEFNIDNSNENNINEELDIKWKEIEDVAQQKINKNKESIKLNFLNSFALMRINLNSLIHPTDDSEFENYCNIKIRNLDKQLNSLHNDSNYNSNILTFISNNIERKNKITTESNIKSFLKPDNDDSDNKSINKYKRYTLNELIELNKNQKTKKRKLDYNKIFDKAYNTNNDNNINNKTFSYNTYNKNDYEDDSYEKRLDRFENKLNEIKNTFLRVDKNITTISNNNKYKNEIQSDNLLNRGYNTTKNNKTIDNIRIKNKIEESFNYLYSLYPELKKSN